MTPGDPAPGDETPGDDGGAGHGPGIEVPFERLTPDALRGVLEEFVTRDGTDLEDAVTKVAEVRALLERGEVQLWFDEATRSCNILRRP